MEDKPLFSSFYGGGFECSSHYNESRRRLDLSAATQHHHYASADYAYLQSLGMRFARDGIRWHIIEKRPDKYDFSSVLPLVRAAQQTGTQVIWDICHYGYPENIDIFKPEFIRRYANFAKAFAIFLLNETDNTPYVVPINEISMWSWAGGDAAKFNPHARYRGLELKAQLVRAAIEGIESFRHVLPETRVVATEPVINVIGDPAQPNSAEHAEQFRLAQYQAWDMLSGREWSMLGGHEKYLDIIGVNYYPWNQWVFGGETVQRADQRYKPFRAILHEVYERYHRPMFVAETSAEGDDRVAWLQYIDDETHAAIGNHVPVQGICWYPILDYPGWDDERVCQTGVLGYANQRGERPVHIPLAEAFKQQVRAHETRMLQPV